MVKLDLKPFLRPEDIGEGERVFTIIDEGELISKEQSPFNRELFQITVRDADGNTYIWTANLTSLRTLSQMYGEDTVNWINKKVTLFTREQLVRGVMRKVIYAKKLES